MKHKKNTKILNIAGDYRKNPLLSWKDMREKNESYSHPSPLLKKKNLVSAVHY